MGSRPATSSAVVLPSQPVLLLLAATLLALSVPSVRAGWLDPDTHKEFRTVSSHYAKDTRKYKLVFSDEFNQDGRTFEDGADPRWTAMDKNDYTNEALHYYSPDNIVTTNGVLNISTIQKTNRYKAFNEKTKKFFPDSKHVQSGMLQGWNKFCMTGGIVEFSAKLPGDAKTGGLWPALWMLGNLARATYVGSSNYVWPYSYDECTEAERQSQKISACSKVGHFGLKPGVGRGAPEIDILEAMGGTDEKLPSTNVTRPYFSTSLQVAPGLDRKRPQLGKLPEKGQWYENLEYGNTTQLNPFFYGVTLVHKPKQFTYQSDAISANTILTTDHFQRMHQYRVEWDPPEEDGSGGHLRWYLDGRFIYGMTGDVLFTKTRIPSEPMYLLMNTAVASSWGFPTPCPDGCDCECYECGNPDCTCGLPDGYCEKNFPAFFEIDYIRAYQAVDEPKHILGCSTEERPTARYIEGHKKQFVDTENRQKEPLLPVQNGGAYCETNRECGWPLKGQCTGGRRCVCGKGYTGPKCLAHGGFDDNPFLESDGSVRVEKVHFAHAFLFMFVVAAVAFILFIGLSVPMKKRKNAKYEQLHSDGGRPIGKVDRNLMQQQQRITGPYQQPENGNGNGNGYNTLETDQQPNQQKTVTYCMIDGRLLDE